MSLFSHRNRGSEFVRYWEIKQIYMFDRIKKGGIALWEMLLDTRPLASAPGKVTAWIRAGKLSETLLGRDGVWLKTWKIFWWRDEHKERTEDRTGLRSGTDPAQTLKLTRTKWHMINLRSEDVQGSPHICPPATFSFLFLFVSGHTTQLAGY